MSKVCIYFNMLLLGLFFLSACKKDKAISDIEKPVDVEKPIEISFSKSRYYPYEVAHINMGNMTLNEDSYSGNIGNELITLFPYSGSLVMLIPALSAGNHILSVQINDKTYEAKITVNTLSEISDPELIFDEHLKAVGNSIMYLKTTSEQLSTADKSNLLLDVNMLEIWQTQLRKQYDALNKEDKKIVAQTIIANSWWMSEVKSAINRLQNREVILDAREYEREIENLTNIYLKDVLKTTKEHLIKVVSKIAVFSVEGEVKSSAGISNGAIVGLGVIINEFCLAVEIANKSQNEIFQIDFIPNGKLLVNNRNVYTNKERTALEITNEYRTIYSADANRNIPLIKDIVTTSSDNGQVMHEMSKFLPFELKYLPQSPSQKSTYYSVKRDVHSDYISIENITNSKVKAESEKQQGIFYVTFNTLEKKQQNFGYTVRYNNEKFGINNYTVQAVLEVEEEVEHEFIIDPRDGQKYKIVKIGTQTWFAENLRYQNSGILHAASSSLWYSYSTSPAWCNYNNDPANDIIYGKLYNWVATGLRLCPDGWHIPTREDWTVLVNYLGGAESAGAKMKSTSDWNLPNTGATNESGFTGLPGGWRHPEGPFVDMGNKGTWWDFTGRLSPGWFHELFYNQIKVNTINSYTGMGRSCRCVSDY